MAFYLLFCSETCLFFLLHHLFLNSLALSSIETLRGGTHPLAVRQILLVSSEEAVPPAERGRKVVHERHVVEVMVLGARPKWNDVLERPGEVVSGMGINGLEKTEGDPDVDGDYVQVWLDPAVE